MAELTVVKAGQTVADAVREGMQQTAQAKQLLELKKQLAVKIGAVVNVLMQNFAIDPDNACSTALSYAAGIAHGTGATKEGFISGAEKIWEAQVAQAEEVKEEQRKMVLTIVRSQMQAQQPVSAQLVAQMQTLGCVVPDDVQKYIEDHPAPTDGQPADVKN